jgi:hypothetical protein
LILFLVVLGAELSAYTLASQVLHHLSHAHSSFCFGYFSDMVSFYARANLNHDPPIYISCLAGMTDAPLHTQILLFEMGSCELPSSLSLPLPYLRHEPL